MSDDEMGHGSFEERIRLLAQEVSRSVERMAQFDIDEIAESIGVDPVRARELADAAARWLSGQAGNLGNEMPSWGPQSPHPMRDEPPRSSGPHPLDLPTGEQGLALSALDSGRWTVEPGSNTLVSSGEGPAPSSTMGLVGELRARDWIAADGEVTLVGRNALARWLDSSKQE